MGSQETVTKLLVPLGLFLSARTWSRWNVPRCLHPRLAPTNEVADIFHVFLLTHQVSPLSPVVSTTYCWGCTFHQSRGPVLPPPLWVPDSPTVPAGDTTPQPPTDCTQAVNNTALSFRLPVDAIQCSHALFWKAPLCTGTQVRPDIEQCAGCKFHFPLQSWPLPLTLRAILLSLHHFSRGFLVLPKNNTGETTKQVLQTCRTNPMFPSQDLKPSASASAYPTHIEGFCSEKSGKHSFLHEISNYKNVLHKTPRINKSTEFCLSS